MLNICTNTICTGMQVEQSPMFYITSRVQLHNDAKSNKGIANTRGDKLKCSACENGSPG